MTVPTLSFVDRVIFTAGQGAGSFVQSAAVTGYQTMQAAGATSGALYGYAAQLSDLSEWEVGYGTWTTATSTLTRTVLFSSNGNAVVNFNDTPQVMITALGESIQLPTFPAASPASITDTLIGVQNGTTDVQFMIGDIIPYIPVSHDVTYYVDSAGSDSNDGSVGSPFATIQHALNSAALFNYQTIYQPTVHVNDGTYSVGAGGIVFPAFFGLSSITAISLLGNQTTPANCVINWTPAGQGFQNTYSQNTINLAGFTLNNAGDNFVMQGGKTNVDDLVINLQNFNATAYRSEFNNHTVFGGVAGGHLDITVSSATNQGTFLLYGIDSARMDDAGVTWTISGVITFVAVVSLGGTARLNWAQGGYVNESNLQGQQFGIGDKGVYFNYQAADRSQLPGTVVGGKNPGSPQCYAQDASTQIVAATAGSTVTITPGTPWPHSQLILNPAGTLATLTVVLPTFMSDGESCRVSTTQAITALTVNAAATFGVTPTVVGAPTTLAAGASFQMYYNQPNTTWYLS